MKKRSKILASLVLAGTMVLGLAGCGDSGSANGGTQSGKNSDAKYQVGICQLVQHEALDAATKGFKDALKDKLGDDVSFDEQNAAGDASTCSTICTTFVTNDYDLILGNEQQKSNRMVALREAGSIGHRPQESRQPATGGKGETGLRRGDTPHAGVNQCPKR